MLDWIWLVPAFPMAASMVFVLCGGRLSHRVATFLAVVPVGLSALTAFCLAASFLTRPPLGGVHPVTLWTWLRVGSFAPQLSFSIDPLSIVMMVVVCFVSFLIHLYSTRFMGDDEGYGRFFAYMNLFVASMLILVLADDLLLLYMSWEAVGLCSYLLIGFWYRDPEHGRAAIKAFVVTRIGDTALAVGLFVLFLAFETLSIRNVTVQAQTLPPGSTVVLAAACLILLGAIGKSAQLPLQTWLPDAMVGPTPVSALIHAATMVAAGVYLIARTHVLFSLAREVRLSVAVIGAVTLLVAACSALVQRKIKRILAYSTISQVGFMFLALGIGAWSAAAFHFMTHAFFKALLFLGAGIIMKALSDEDDIFKMGGLRTRLPMVFLTFLIGGASLASLPFVTAGFYSKDLIIANAWSSPYGGIFLGTAAVVGAFLTALYTFRLIFLVFFGQEKTETQQVPGLSLTIPLVVFALGALTLGFLQTPTFLGGVQLFGGFLSGVFYGPIAQAEASTDVMPTILGSCASLLGIGLAYLFFLSKPRLSARFTQTPAGNLVFRFWLSGWGFDPLYQGLFVTPFIRFAGANREDAIDLPYRALALLSSLSSRALVLSQSGKVRWYAMGIVAGGIVITGMVILL